MHHASRITQPSGKHRKKKLILCYVTSDMPVTQVTPGKPRKFKIQVQSSKSRVAVWGLRQGSLGTSILSIIRQGWVDNLASHWLPKEHHDWFDLASHWLPKKHHDWFDLAIEHSHWLWIFFNCCLEMVKPLSFLPALPLL